MHKMNSRGFTLVELLVTLAISGIVMAVVVGIFFSGANAFKSGAERNTDKMICDGAYNFAKQQLIYASSVSILPNGSTTPEGMHVLEIQDGKLFLDGRNVFHDEYYGNRKISMWAEKKALNGEAAKSVNIKIATLNPKGEAIYSDNESINALNMSLFKANTVQDLANGAENPKICFEQKAYVPPKAGDPVADEFFAHATTAKELYIKMLNDVKTLTGEEKKAAQQLLKDTFNKTFFNNEALRDYVKKTYYNDVWPDFNRDIIDENIATITIIENGDPLLRECWSKGNMEICVMSKSIPETVGEIAAIYAHKKGPGQLWNAYGIYDTENGVWSISKSRRGFNLANKTAAQIKEEVQQLVDQGEWIVLE